MPIGPVHNSSALLTWTSPGNGWIRSSSRWLICTEGDAVLPRVEGKTVVSAAWFPWFREFRDVWSHDDDGCDAASKREGFHFIKVLMFRFHNDHSPILIGDCDSLRLWGGLPSIRGRPTFLTFGPFFDPFGRPTRRFLLPGGSDMREKNWDFNV